MTFERRTDKILVLTFNEQNVFCGMDATRIVFSPSLHLGYLPEQHFGGKGGIQETIIRLGNAEEPIAEGIIITNGEPPSYKLLGWKEFFADKPAIANPDRVTLWEASWFTPGDRIEIIKDDWNVTESSIDHLLSRRTTGYSFAEVFFLDESIINQLAEFFSVDPKELGSKKVIFETYPGDTYKKYF